MRLIIIKSLLECDFQFDIEKLKAKLTGWDINILKTEVSPSVCLQHIEEACAELHPDLIMGIGTSGMLVHQLKNQHRIIVLPHFYPSKALKQISQYDDATIKEFEALEATQFDNLPANDWQYLSGLFYRTTASEIGTDENCFKRRYKYNYYYTNLHVWAKDKEYVLATMVDTHYNMANPTQRPIVYIDMDNVLVDFKTLANELQAEQSEEYLQNKDHLDDIPGFFGRMEPLVGAVEAFRTLNKKLDVYILSTAPWDNDTAWSDKIRWVKRHLGPTAYKKLILSHHKDLNKGDYLIDDSSKNGAKEFGGKWLQFGKAPYENWDKVLDYFKKEGLI